MKAKIPFCSALFLAFILPLLSVSAQNKTKKTLFIIVDGIPADVLEQQPTPNLKKIAAMGGYTQAYVGGDKGEYSETPTISAVGYNSLLTGTWANKHNVWDNKITAPNYNYKTIFRYLKTHYPEKRTAIFSTWLDNRTKLLGEGKPETQSLTMDYHFDGFELDTVNFPHDKESNYIRQIDEHVAKEAARYVQTAAPDLSWVYLEYPDDMGHRHGDGPQMNEAIALADKQIGQIWESVQERQQKFNEEWLIVITTDHGRDAQGKHHGKQTDRERTTWIITNYKNINEQFKQVPAMVDIMPSICRFMDISIPREELMELDGVPFIGKVSITNPSAILQNQTIPVTWKAQEKIGKVKVWLSTTNNYQQGKKDNYTLVNTAPVAAGKAIIDVSNIPSGFYKIVLEAPHNSVNRWVLVK